MKLHTGDEIVFTGMPMSSRFCSEGDHKRFVRFFAHTRGLLYARVARVKTDEIVFVLRHYLRSGSKVTAEISMTRTKTDDIREFTADFIDLISL